MPFLIREVWQCNKVTIVVYHGLDAARADVHFGVLRNVQASAPLGFVQIQTLACGLQGVSSTLVAPKRV